MLELNKVMVVGRLTRDPEMRMLPSGSSVANFSIAISRSRRDQKTNEYVEETVFVDVKAWNRQAEFVEQYFSKGKGVYVEGRLTQESWETDGQKRSKIVLVAEQVKFAESKAEEDVRLSRAGSSGGGYDGGSSQQQQRPPRQSSGGSYRRNDRADDDDGPSGMPPMPGGDSGGINDDLPF